MNRANFLPYREIHLDFHTSEAIPAIGADFDPDEFAETLVNAHVNSITCFARCHHGWIYYDTALHPERRHPHLTRNLLREQIDACHARGIRVPIYTTVQWDHFTARQHPEWLCVDENGRFVGTKPFEAGFYRELNVSSPYVETFLKPHVREILTTLPTDGLFFDIVRINPSTDPYTQAHMRAAGLDPANPQHRARFALDALNDFKQEMSAFVRAIQPEVSIFYNAGHVGTRHRPVADAYSHWELETLPSGGWGYQHFPVSARYARTLGIDLLGMTGKFHTSWGDFHSFKNLAALQYEVFQMLALNAKCMVGDQLPPRGRIEPYVYERIGQVYAEVEQKEPWCDNARPLTDIALFTPEEFAGGSAGQLPDAIKGATRMLEEATQQFDIVDSAADLSPYQVVILPDSIPVDAALAAKLDSFLAQGGKLIATFESGLTPDQQTFGLPALGVTLASEGPRDAAGNLARGRVYDRTDYVEYILPGAEIGQGLPPTEHAMYIRGLDIQALPESSVLASIVPSYFDRTWEHFCSHRHTPSSGQPGNPAVVRTKNTIYFSSPLFTIYQKIAPLWCKRLLVNALKLLLPEPLVRHGGPTTLQAALNEQPAQQRQVLHLLHYIPERRAEFFDILEDVIPLYQVSCSVRVPTLVQRVTAVPQGTDLPFAMNGSRVEFTVPTIEGHQMLSIQF
ncbi:MAG: beta-galactosidase trimerization domain-containing protein [Chloroflexi bacterium]|nr:beta-galactosidase trimerization domain-containing protein [Chloroflexota bacterium]